MDAQIKPAKYSAMDLAKYIITLCTNMGNAISDLKLQKVLYYIQLAFILNLGEEAFQEDLEAWPYGPVVREVYDNYSSYGSTKICLQYDNTDIFTEKEVEVINAVLYNCLNKDAWDLVSMSHVQGGPWDVIYKNGQGYKSVIPKELIRQYALR